MTNISESHRIHLTRDLTPNNHSIDSVSIFDQSEKETQTQPPRIRCVFPRFLSPWQRLPLHCLNYSAWAQKLLNAFPLLSQVTPFFPQSFIPAIHFPPLRLFAHLPTLSTSCMISLCSDWFTSLLTVVWQIQYDLVTKKPLLGRLQTCTQNSQACWAAAMSKCGYWRISYSGSSVRTPCSWYQLPTWKKKS